MKRGTGRNVVWRGANERTEHACGSHTTDGSVLSKALQYSGRACFVMSVQPAALV